jgi:uncharacterized SAM-binding protein YcdF (DUF218 family)
MRRRWLRVVLAVLLLLVLWGALDLGYVVWDAEHDYAARADAIIVLGCNIVGSVGPSPCISARAEHAADLYGRGLAPWVIATGGPVQGSTTEAEVLAYVLERDGVPHDAIIQEQRALNTIQNMEYSQEIMRERGWSSAILVTEPFHIKRAALIARDDGMTIYPSPAVNSINWQSWPVRVFSVLRDTLSLMLYQVKSLVGHRE